MSEATPLERDSEHLAAYLKAAADPLRLQILRLLAQDSYGVLELARVFAVKQSGMSHHLKLLAQAGLAATRREGNSIFYRRALVSQGELGALQRALYAQVDSLTLTDEVEARLALVRADRVVSSQAFFNDNSDRFRSQQDLIASYPVYADAVAEFLQKTFLQQTFLQQTQANRRQLALEIGPGEGEFLAVLSPLFEQVLAVDINQAMLEQAARAVDAARLANVELHLAEAGNWPFVAPAAVDLAVANMVLHHVPSPVALFQQVAEVLRPGGSFVITDLSLHDQNWARESCGDVWLGFDPDDLTDWAANCGFSAGQSLYFALRNGFQIQIRQFVKETA
ncbi:metalloregulator ArsR/SmtB family transcription factor [Halioxenophilus sp. WMMB6]|uniref:ArsR/SmtB family transcription factor n=1 Tax=Halioxenophilus sp. WMMB6 TaxID=3073815 RepID=UPI00295F078D|nr:metalloregulator ArsR/SmtB family transcription factor [Halioxenophilus sp. WMMB6]